MNNNKKDRSGAIGCITGIASFAILFGVLYVVDGLMEDFGMTPISSTGFLLPVIIIIGIICFGLIPWLFLKRTKDTSVSGKTVLNKHNLKASFPDILPNQPPNYYLVTFSNIIDLLIYNAIDPTGNGRITFHRNGNVADCTVTIVYELERCLLPDGLSVPSIYNSSSDGIGLDISGTEFPEDWKMDSFVAAMNRSTLVRNNCVTISACKETSYGGRVTGCRISIRKA